MTDKLISTTAAACREFAAEYDPNGEENEGFMTSWEGCWDAYQEMKSQCPVCDPDDPGDPPPTR